MRRLDPVDARMLWAAPAARSDQFLLYAFDATEVSDREVRDQVLAAAASIGELTVVVREVPGHLDYPGWVLAPVRDEQVRCHSLDDPSWSALLDAVGALLADQVDPSTEPWRVHLFSGVADSEGPLRIAVLQISHALADGRGASDLARRLFSPSSLPPTSPAAGPTGSRLELPAPVRAGIGLLRLPGQVGRLVVGGVRSYRLSRGDPEVGSAPVPAAWINRWPGARRVLRTLTVDRARLGRRVTPTVIAAIGDALSGQGLVDGDPVVELTLGRERVAGRANNFHMAGIASRTDLAGAARLAAISAAIDAARDRDRRPARIAARTAEAATPAPMMHWATTGFESPAGVPSAVTGHTVVSSVNRGDADLVLGGGRVRFTAGFPALSAVHSLTHGVHGIGDTVTISVLADPDTADADAHAAALRAALGVG